MAELNYELWVGDAAQIRARAVRRQKTDSRDAEHLLELLSTQRFPRLWIPSPEQRDWRATALQTSASRWAALRRQ